MSVETKGPSAADPPEATRRLPAGAETVDAADAAHADADRIAAAPKPSRTATWATWGLGAVVAVAAMVSGLSAASGDKTLAVLPVAGMVAIGLGWLALTRFSTFVLLLLGVRASIDLFKLSGASAGSTATNTAASRGLDPSSMIAMLFLFSSVLWLIAQYSSGRRLKGSPVRTALLCFVVACVISCIGSARIAPSLLETLRILSVVMMFVILEQVITDRIQLIRTLVTCYLAMAVPLLYTLGGLVLGSPASEVKGSFTRITGPFSQSNTFARYLAFMIVFGVALLPALSRRLQVAMGAVLALSTVFLVLTLTRGALIAAVVGVVVVAVAQSRWRLLFTLGMAGAVAVLLVPGLSDRFETLGTEQAVGGRPTGNSLAWRFEYWTEVLPLANSNPVTGIGLNMTQYETSAEKQPHNDFVRAYVETGLVGLGAYTSVHVALLWAGVRAVRRTARRTLEHAVAAGALGCATCFLLGSLAANVMSNVVSLWYLVAFAAAASYVARGPGRSGDVQAAVATRPAAPSVGGAGGAWHTEGLPDPQPYVAQR